MSNNFTLRFLVVFSVEALELPPFLPFRSFCAVFRALPSCGTLGSNEIPGLALVVSVPTVCFKNERYTSIYSLCSSLQRCKNGGEGGVKKEKKTALLSRTALLLRHRLDSFSRSAERSDISLLLFRVTSRCVSTRLSNPLKFTKNFKS